MTLLMNVLFPNRQKPKKLWQLESENFAWIDFFWSSLGRSGNAGKKVESIYESLANPKAQKKLLTNLKNNLPKILGLSRMKKWLVKQTLGVVVFFVQKILPSFEKSQTDQYLSKQGRKSLADYLTGPIALEMKSEFEKLQIEMPKHFSFIFGHTHKPHVDPTPDVAWPYGSLETHNTGGWVVEDTSPMPIHGGAMVLLDQHLNAVSVQLYNENGGGVNVQIASEDDPQAVSFRNHIQNLIDGSKDQWDTFSQQVKSDLPGRRKDVQETINRIINS
jgi:hypothetical protein